ncbi:S9 family peptidase [Pseudomonas sp. CG7]|uniref:S9 family peptidase n=1 Tax=Pseudomonas sp. CG7 TaxID=191007 RepID=UPI002033A44A|nr:S9 family peptidase [Pseudomonas sp. CG7]MCM2459432.1 S9 family peptidase [Pseudomonas sp. CG7]
MSNLTAQAFSEAPTKRSFGTEDIARVKALDQLAISPDGTKLVFHITEPSPTPGLQEGALWILDLELRHASLLFSEQHDDSRPRWSPDGSKLAFLRSDEGVTQLHILPTKKGQVCSLTELINGVGDYQWAPDGNSIAFTSAVPSNKITPPAGVRIFTRADYRANGGNDDFAVAQIWVVDVTANCVPTPARQLTHQATNTTLAFWSSDGNAVFFTTDDTVEAYYGGGKSTLRSVVLSSGEQGMTRALKIPGTGEDLASAPELIPSPDGSKVAFTLRNPEAPPEFAQDDIFVMDLASGVTVNVTADYDREMGASGLMWKNDHRLITINNDFGNANLVEVDIANHQIYPLWLGDRVVESFHFSRAANRLIAVASDFITPPELYLVGEGGGIQLGATNQHIRDERSLTKPEAITYQRAGGGTIHGYLHKPPVVDPHQKYPLIVWAHGGPYSWWNSAFDGDIQAMAAAGYFVMYINPRGSASYGQAFASALADKWPGPEYEDTMSGVDYLLSRPEIDAGRLGIAGGSAGGILTDWAITHTDRFAAAVSISSIADNSLYWFLGDQPDMAAPNIHPWLDMKDRELSPITHGLNVKTPTLFMAGTRDRRTPPATGSELMFMLLKHLRVPTALIEFEGAGHVIRGGDDARHRGLSIHYLLRWMDHHLKGQSAPEFQM